ncbi:hypothetical protein JZ751_027459 [Albula glossodonta]|uniref:Uncharacterized protein n=1 Tax=Albula glossodonta TaxID=121402 RepID=A0A8T2N0A9_9TELE|nr:hypothetical protein JZ751_027459 [Albula glossodonta]
MPPSPSIPLSHEHCLHLPASHCPTNTASISQHPTVPTVLPLCVKGKLPLNNAKERASML